LNLIKFRITVSVAFFIGCAMLFAGPEYTTVLLSAILPPLQFVPALIRTLLHPHTFFLAGLILLVAVTLIFGRVYCSFLCPLGTLQDMITAGARKCGLKSEYAFTQPRNVLRYAVLAITAAAISVGILSFVNLLDPYSLTGRLISNIALPQLVSIYNLSITLLKPFDIYLYPKQTAFVPLSVLAATSGFLGLITCMAIKHGRLYCNTICPVGTFLGLLARISFFKFKFDHQGCSECVRCEKVCKASCIDPKRASIDMSRCVGCFNCVDACSKTVIVYRKAFGSVRPDAWSPARRGFVLGSATAAGGLLLWFNPALRAVLGTTQAIADPPVTPPGSISVFRFTQACTACCLCVSACPTSVLTPAFMDYGPAGLLQPKMNYAKSFCEYECNVCSKVCPTGAISPVSLAEKKLTQIAEARLLENVCVVFVDHTNCGACGEVCPTHAIRFTDKNNILYPEIDKQYCIGCGACQLACPTKPNSIVIHAHPVHQKAEKYVRLEAPAEAVKPADQDFPF
jgi:ferredoxin